MKLIASVAAGTVDLRNSGGRLLLRGDKDRKSTRLNSSHLGISYAVFCLKKKKKKPEPNSLRHLLYPVLLEKTIRQVMRGVARQPSLASNTRDLVVKASGYTLNLIACLST